MCFQTEASVMLCAGLMALEAMGGPGSLSGPIPGLTCGTGLPTATRLRRYQNPPASRTTALHSAVRRMRSPGRLSHHTPSVIASTAKSEVYFTPTARPAASAATASSPRLGAQPSSRSALTSSASAARTRATTTTSLYAPPGSSATSSAVPRTAAQATSAAGATPKRRPRHQAASSDNASQPRFWTHERMSLPSSTMPTACRSSDEAG